MCTTTIITCKVRVHQEMFALIRHLAEEFTSYSERNSIFVKHRVWMEFLFFKLHQWCICINGTNAGNNFQQFTKPNFIFGSLYLSSFYKDKEQLVFWYWINPNFRSPLQSKARLYFWIYYMASTFKSWDSLCRYWIDLTWLKTWQFLSRRYRYQSNK